MITTIDKAGRVVLPAAVAVAAGAQLLVTGNRRHFVSLLRRGLRVPTAEVLLAELPR